MPEAPVLSINPRIHRLEGNFLGKTPDEILPGELTEMIGKKISRLVLGKLFNSEAVFRSIMGSIRSDLQQTFLDVIRKEERNRSATKYPSESTDPLLRHLSKTFGKDVQPESVVVSAPDVFFADFEKAFAKEKKVLEFLERVCAHPAMEHILPLLQKLATLDKDGWRLQEQGAAKAYDMVKPLVGDSRYAFPHTEAEILYFLTYLPHTVRHPSQELLVYNTDMNFVHEKRDAAVQEGKKTDMHDTLLDALAHNIFDNNHWQRLCEYEGSSERMNAEIATEQTMCSRVQKRMMDLVRADQEHRTVLEEFVAYKKGVFERIEALHKQQGSHALQQQDIYHCFRNGVDDECRSILRPDGRVYEDRKKDGSIAAILEDDPRQMADWKDLIQHHSPYALPDDGKNVYAAPGPDLVALADDPSVRLFLIDIQNGEDKTAGIRVAEQIVERMLASLPKDKKNVERVRDRRDIILWTTSPELLAAAERHFAPLFEKNEWKLHASEGISSGSDSDAIHVYIQLKSDYRGFVA